MAIKRSEISQVSEGGENPAHLTRWPDYSEMRCQMDELFNRALGYTPLSSMFAGDTQLLDPDLDIYEIGDKVVVIVALPGFSSDRIEVKATCNVVTLQGEREPLFENDEAVAYRLGWSTGVNRVHTKISLPRLVDPCESVGTIANGVLKLEFLKTNHQVSDLIRVPVRGM